jgi:hypothetical protein
MISKKVLIAFINKFFDKTLDITVAWTKEEIEKYKTLLEKKFNQLQGVIDVTNIDENLLEFAKEMGLIKIYTFGKKKAAKLTAWFSKMHKAFDDSDFGEFFNNILKKFTK